jgi:hypothetical protein
MVPTAILIFMLAHLGSPGQIAREHSAEAEHEIRRVAPEAYRGLPASVARYLRRHGYTIPQTYDVARQHNAVSGLLDDDTERDWAVLASRDGYSQILVFWGGTVASVTRLEPRADAGYLQTVGTGARIGYSRGIGVVGREYILDHHQAYGGPMPPPILHDAIEDGFSGKASVVYYFDGTRWYTLQGAD